MNRPYKLILMGVRGTTFDVPCLRTAFSWLIGLLEEAVRHGVGSERRELHTKGMVERQSGTCADVQRRRYPWVDCWERLALQLVGQNDKSLRTSCGTRKDLY